MTTNKLIYVYYGESFYYTDADAFASDVTQSIYLLDPENPEQEPDMHVFEQMRILWRVAHAPFQELLSDIGLSQAECSVRFCINPETVQRWVDGSEPCEGYIRLMMAEAVGLLDIRDYIKNHVTIYEEEHGENR